MYVTLWSCHRKSRYCLPCCYMLIRMRQRTRASSDNRSVKGTHTLVGLLRALVHRWLIAEQGLCKSGTGEQVFILCR